MLSFIVSEITLAPSKLGWIPSLWFSFGFKATFFSKKGIKFKSYSSANLGKISSNFFLYANPFVGDASLSGGVKVLSDGTTSSEQKRLDIFTYKLTGLVQSDSNSFISLINQDGENVTVEINEEVNEGVKLIDMNQKEVVFLVEETDSYLIMNFKNEIKETSEY